MSTVGHPKITKRAYEQDADVVREAVQFAVAAVHNGLGSNGQYLTHAAVTKLIAQVERDYLVSIMSARFDRSVGVGGPCK